MIVPERNTCQMKSDLGNSDLLRAERKRLGWSQAKVAKALGVDVTTVRRWERGRVAPFPYHRRKICALFAKTPQELGLPPDADEQGKVPSTDVLSDTAAEASLVTNSAMPEAVGSAKSQIG